MQCVRTDAAATAARSTSRRRSPRRGRWRRQKS